MPQTPYMKDLDQIGVMAKAEMGFIKMIVLPLWSIVDLFLDHEVEGIIKNLNKNAERWEKIYLESSKDSEKKSIFTNLFQEEITSETNSMKDESNLKRSKSLFSNLKKGLMGSADKKNEQAIK